MSAGDFGYDPELPGGFQDADFDMRELEEAGRRAADAKRRADNRAKLAAMSFEEWRACVDSWVVRLAGVSADDLPDWNYADAYAEREHPKVTARAAIRNARE